MLIRIPILLLPCALQDALRWRCPLGACGKVQSFRRTLTLRHKNAICMSLACAPGILLSGCQSAPKPFLSNKSFHFGKIAAPLTSTRDVVTVTNTGKAITSISASVSGDPSLKLDPGLSCRPSLFPGGSCSMIVSFAPCAAGGHAPQDWFYGKHQVTLVGAPTRGKLSLTMMDNGYGRILANGEQCPASRVAGRGIRWPRNPAST